MTGGILGVRAVLFDVNGTLVDIHTEEGMEQIFRAAGHFLTYQGIDLRRGQVRDRYFELLKTWRDLLALNYTTWPESRDQPRSDTHAWSAHPTADLLGIVAGIRPAAPGYSRLRVEPRLGSLTSLDATAATPHGPVKVSYRSANNQLIAVIDRPASLPGTFTWRGKSHPLTETHTKFELPL